MSSNNDYPDHDPSCPCHGTRCEEGRECFSCFCPKPLRVLSLFAGIGGIDLGLEAHGCTTVAYSEVDPHASSVMARHFPDAVNLGDITAIDWEDVAREHTIDIICGGFPCQDISVAGRGAGIAEGTRSGLWTNYADAIRHLRPRGVLVENVAALLARGIDRVLGDLATLGFDAEWDCIPAAAVGAPHLRDRVFVVAYRPDAQGSTGWLAGHTHRARAHALASGGGTREAVGEPGGGDAAAGADAERERRERRRATGDVARTAGAREGEGHQRERHGDAAVDLRAAAPHADRAGRREQRWPVPVPEELATAERGSWWSAEPQVGRVGDGFPGRVDQLRCLGNAVVPAVAEHVAGILIDRIEAA